MESSALYSRLRNCLLTILELEGTLGETHLGSALREDFVTLKHVLHRLHDVRTEENDVRRIEAATTRFLDELKGTFDKGAASSLSTARVLH